MLLTLDIDLKTGKAKILEIIKEDESLDPEITLVPNKLMFNNAALHTLGASPGDEVSIQYVKLNDKLTPLIFKSALLDIKGNKITKSNTVSFRGEANQVLSSYGSTFVLQQQKEGFFYMINPEKDDQSKIDMNVEEINFDLGNAKSEDDFNIDFDSLEL